MEARSAIATSVTTSAAPDPFPSKAAYARRLVEISAVEDSSAPHITADVLSSVTRVLGALWRLRELRGEIEATFKSFDFEEFDKLEDYALALSHAHSLWKGASAPKVDVGEQAAALAIARDELLIAARALATRGLIEGGPLNEVKSQAGYRHIASDIVTMVSLIQSRWSAVEGKTALTFAELNELGARANGLLMAIGQKEQAPTSPGEASLIRRKAFYLFERAYENARRAVAYIREDPAEAEEIAPSIFGGRRKRGERSEAEAVTGEKSATDGENGADAAKPASDEAPPPFKLNNPLNLPITNPFTS